MVFPFSTWLQVSKVYRHQKKVDFNRCHVMLMCTQSTPLSDRSDLGHLWPPKHEPPEKLGTEAPRQGDGEQLVGGQLQHLQFGPSNAIKFRTELSKTYCGCRGTQHGANHYVRIRLHRSRRGRARNASQLRQWKAHLRTLLPKILRFRVEKLLSAYFAESGPHEGNKKFRANVPEGSNST